LRSRAARYSTTQLTLNRTLPLTVLPPAVLATPVRSCVSTLLKAPVLLITVSKRLGADRVREVHDEHSVLVGPEQPVEAFKRAAEGFQDALYS
jgi:hypothetical protein